MLLLIPRSGHAKTAGFVLVVKKGEFAEGNAMPAVAMTAHITGH